jgi:CRISPR/Cas system-associated exonuclease Cas4 (RecB family)
MIKELLHAYGSAQRREFAHDRLSTLGSSAQGRCIRQTTYVVLGVSPDEGFTDSWGAALRGTMMEDHFWAPALRASLQPPAELLFAGEDQVTMVDEEARLSATPDGLVVGLGRDCLSGLGTPDCLADSVLVECKSIDPRALLRKQKPEHEFQVQMAMGLVRRCTDYAPEYAVISYINASFWDQVTEFPVRYSERVYQAGAERARAVFEATNALDMPPEGKIAGGEECKYCGYALQCGAGEVARVPPGSSPGEGGVRLSADAAAELKGLRDAERKLAGAIEDNVATKELAREAIKQFLHAHGVRSHKGEGWSVTWSVTKGRVTLDKDALAETIDLTPFTKEGEPSERLIVT